MLAQLSGFALGPTGRVLCLSHMERESFFTYGGSQRLPLFVFPQSTLRYYKQQNKSQFLMWKTPTPKFPGLSSVGLPSNISTPNVTGLWDLRILNRVAMSTLMDLCRGSKISQEEGGRVEFKPCSLLTSFVTLSCFSSVSPILTVKEAMIIIIHPATHLLSYLYSAPPVYQALVKQRWGIQNF